MGCLRAGAVAIAVAISVFVPGGVAIASDSAIPVTLKVVAGSRGLDVGQPATVRATAALRKGERLLIQAFPPERTPVALAACRRSPCSTTYRAAGAGEVGFQAFVVSGVGRKKRTLGRSKRVTVAWRAPAPPPAATTGHYEGTVGVEDFRFDIAPDGLSLTNLQIGAINESCQPPRYLSVGSLVFRGPVGVGVDGSFTLSSTFDGTVDDNPAVYAIRITGRVTSGIASGTLHLDTSYTENGQNYSCSSGDQPWTASRA